MNAAASRLAGGIILCLLCVACVAESYDKEAARAAALSASLGATRAVDALSDLAAADDPQDQGVRDFAHESVGAALQMAEQAHTEHPRLFANELEASMNASLLAGDFFDALRAALTAHEDMTESRSSYLAAVVELEAHRRTDARVDAEIRRAEVLLLDRQKRLESEELRVGRMEKCVSGETLEAGLCRGYTLYTLRVARRGLRDIYRPGVEHARSNLKAAKAGLQGFEAVDELNQRVSSLKEDYDVLASVASEKIQTAEALRESCMDQYRLAASKWESKALAI